MPSRPFHHGNLRAELLERARVTLRETGEEGVSLRQLARDVGVSHAAPRRHFPDRQQLLLALAEQGFTELTATITESVNRSGGGADAVFRAVARSYVDFARGDAALMNLMFSAKNHEAAADVAGAAERFFAVTGSLLQQVAPDSAVRIPDRSRLQLLLAATLHGIASLAGTGRIGEAQVGVLIEDAGSLFGVADAQK
ncbi:TetR/AcrR family transcriptional regulator [Amycolatopsis sp. PS_44_ISF1]|uniref:TetR/AcrR family transcriptional regulator n=1 Tax=Amycolatopsis sp. PS_44_ISF1 TaxID=2974917 RepID=UPI0028DE3C23|nr:TetR/AcrR family transcriptional regulator [Amycolatopsis sp. PS_44_ISF1]MDT8912337.1 TetR/AcrR family transcriptional regulator [Amycolatopsis sp. PS_44_ISF1]